MCLDDYRKKKFPYFFVILVLYVVFFGIFLPIVHGATIDKVTVDLTLATMTEGVTPEPIPSPFDCPTCKDTGWIMHGDGHQTKCPNCDLAKLPGGIFDTIAQAKELIRKGNLLADRGKQLLDAIQEDGKISVDIKLPDVQVAIIEKKQEVKEENKLPPVACYSGSCNVSPYRYTPKKKSSWRWKR